MSDLAEIRTDLRLIAVDVGALRQWCTSHEQMHVGIAADIAGLEGREREATGRVEVPLRSNSDAPRKGVRIDLSRVTVRDMIVAVALVVSLVMGGSAALSSTDDNEAAMKKLEKIARVVAEIEAVQAAALPAPPEEVE